MSVFCGICRKIDATYMDLLNLTNGAIVLIYPLNLSKPLHGKCLGEDKRASSFNLPTFALSIF